MFSESPDGITWSPVRRASDLVNIGSQQAMISAKEADGRHFLYYTASHGLVLDLEHFDEVTSRRDGLVRYSQDDGCVDLCWPCVGCRSASTRCIRLKVAICKIETSQQLSARLGSVLRRTWWLLEPAVIRPGPFMYSGIVRRGGNATHVTLGFVFESFGGEVAACEPWCSATEQFGLADAEPATNLTITYVERSFVLPPPQPHWEEL